MDPDIVEWASYDHTAQTQADRSHFYSHMGEWGKGPYLTWCLGWMTCNFTSFSTVFQSNQDGGSFIMKGCVLWNPFLD